MHMLDHNLQLFFLISLSASRRDNTLAMITGDLFADFRARCKSRQVYDLFFISLPSVQRNANSDLRLFTHMQKHIHLSVRIPSFSQ